MERGDGGGGMAPRGGGVGSAAMLGLDMHLAPQQMHPGAAFQHQQGGFQLQQPAPVAVAVRQQQAPPSFSPYSNTSSSRVVVSAAAVGPGHDDDIGGGRGGVVVPQQQQQQMASAACPWTRMKWTDNMVRLLIGVVYSVGDDGEGVATAGGAGAGKAGRAGSSGHGHGHAAAAQQQKKGKWKSVSRAMMDKGFVVSPQQCEDKFNDLNKRYKRVVDLLGRGRACRVVENHAMLDTLDDLTPKAKDEARKLLSSKHLFFREMCTYHNNLLPHAGGGAAGDAAACLHHPLPAPVAASASSAARHAYAQQQAAASSPPGMKDSSADVADDDEDDDSDDDAVSDNGDEDEDEDDYDEEDVGHMYHSNNRPSRQHRGSGGGRSKRGRGENGAAAEDLDDEAEGGGRGRRRARRAAARVAPDPSAMLRQLKSELASGTAAAMDPQQARSWMRRRAVEVEEQQIRLDSHACYLDGQRLKWERFRADKDRDMERARLQNDRLRMESRRLLLMLRHKDIELDMAEANSSSVDHLPGASPLAAHQQQQPIGSSPSPSTAGHPN